MPHKILIVGVGSIGERHLRCFAATERAEVGLCELNADLAQAAAQRYDVDRVHADLDDALGHDYDAAVICTPAPFHLPQATQAVEAGLHVLIEKPLSVSPEGVDQLQARVEAANRVAAVAYVYRANPALTAMKAAIDSGRFGRPVQLVAVGGQHFPTYRPAYREIYYARRDQGGGAIQDALTHVLNAGEWLCGPITALTADAEHLLLEGVEVEDTAHVLARQGDVLASYSLNQHQAPNELAITVACERGTCRFEYHQQRWRWQTDPKDDWHDQPSPPLERDDLFRFQAEAFLDAIEGRRKPLCSLADGAQTLKVNLAVLRAAERTDRFLNL